MATITVHPEHLHGLRLLLYSEFECACDERDGDKLRDLIAFGDQLGWEADAPAPAEVLLSDELLEYIATEAWTTGHSRLADFHGYLARGDVDSEPNSGPAGQSMLAFADQHRRAKAVA